MRPLITKLSMVEKANQHCQDNWGFSKFKLSRQVYLIGLNCLILSKLRKTKHLKFFIFILFWNRSTLIHFGTVSCIRCKRKIRQINRKFLKTSNFHRMIVRFYNLSKKGIWMEHIFIFKIITTKYLQNIYPSCENNCKDTLKQLPKYVQ